MPHQAGSEPRIALLTTGTQLLDSLTAKIVHIHNTEQRISEVSKGIVLTTLTYYTVFLDVSLAGANVNISNCPLATLATGCDQQARMEH